MNLKKLSQLTGSIVLAFAQLYLQVEAAPNQAQITGSKIVNSTRVANLRLEGVQGRKSGGGGGFSFLGIGAKGSGGRSTDSLKTEANIGQIVVGNAAVIGSQITQQTNVANAHVKGATLNAGQILIGRQ